MHGDHFWQTGKIIGKSEAKQKDLIKFTGLFQDPSQTLLQSLGMHLENMYLKNKANFHKSTQEFYTKPLTFCAKIVQLFQVCVGEG